LRSFEFKGAVAAGVLALAFIAGTPCRAAEREPSEAEMRAAMERIITADRARADAMAQRCSGVGERSGSVEGQMGAFECLFGMAGQASLRQMSIRSFEKLHCGAATTGGYYCDYAIAMNTPFGASAVPSAGRKRFVNTKNGWMALD
jgi:hypothetical protein